MTFIFEKLLLEYSEKQKKEFYDTFTNGDEKTGKDLLDLFDKSKQLLLNNNISNDIQKWISDAKKDPGKVEELKNILYNLSTRQNRVDKDFDIRQKRVPGEYKILWQGNGKTLYRIDDVVASMALGVNTGWCTAGRYGHYGDPSFVPSREAAERHFNNHENPSGRGIGKLYYLVDDETGYGIYAWHFMADKGGSYVRYSQFDAEDKCVRKGNTPDDELGEIAYNDFVGYTTDIIKNIPEFEIENSTLIRYNGGGGDITVPNSVTSIGSYAFSDCTGLTSVTIPDSVTSIGEYAFSGCTRLKSVTIQNSVTRIGDNAFAYCTMLKSVKIGEGVTSIGEWAFYNCDNLTSITIPDSVTRIGDHAFQHCRCLTNITVPGSVTSIGNCAFRECTGLTSVTIQDGATSIGGYAFEWCYNLTSVTIGKGVTRIGDRAFHDCRKLTSITIPDSVTRIDTDAFDGCYSLKDVYYGGTEEDWDRIHIGKYNDALYNADIHFNSIKENYKRGNKMRIVFKENRSLNEDIESMKKYFPNIPDEKFQSLIELDPTYKRGSKNAGKYGRWILQLANKGNLKNVGHVFDLLTRFEEESKNLINRDIMRYKSMEEVENMLNDDSSYRVLSHRQEVRERQKARKNADLENEAELLYEDNDWEVWTPLTYAASCKLGKGASWCTASTESDYYYYYYQGNYGGKYYININKHNPEEKYQFHFPTDQFMDINDDSIDLSNFLDKNPGLKEFYTDILYEEYVKKWGLKNGETAVETDVLAEILSAKAEGISKDFLEACFDGNVFEYFLDISYGIDLNIVHGFIDEVDEDNKNVIEKITGMSIQDKDFMDVIYDEFPDVMDALTRAVDNGLVVGAESECMSDFKDAVDNSMKPFVSSYWYDGEGKMHVKVDMEQLKTYIIDLIDEAAYQEADVDYFSEVLGWYMYDEFYFYEPRYGWNGFDEETFNSRLSDELYEVEKAIEKENNKT